MSLGILGGTFNPIHLAHLRLAEEAREALALDSVCFVPAAQPPLKSSGVAPARERLEMVELATASNPGFRVLDLELRRDGPSYTVDTLRELARRNPGERLWFLLGSDALAEFELWHEPDEILELTSLGVARRPWRDRSLPPEDLEALLPERFRGSYRRGPNGLEHASGPEIRFVPLSPLSVSATDVRSRAASGRSIRYLVADPVIDYIEKHGLYRKDGSE